MAANSDMKSANQTYESFTVLVKFGTIACVVIAAFVVLLISS
jgi:hypothetical protein